MGGRAHNDGCTLEEGAAAFNRATTTVLLLSHWLPRPTCGCLPALQAPGPNVAPAAGARKGLLDNYDDAEGYYNFQVGVHTGASGYTAARAAVGFRTWLAGAIITERPSWVAQVLSCWWARTLLTCTAPTPPLPQVGELIGEPGGPQYEVYATHGKVRCWPPCWALLALHHAMAGRAAAGW